MAPSHKERLASAEVQRSLVARRRFEVARTAAGAGPRPSDMVRAVSEILPRLDGWVPTRPTICALAELWRNGPDEARRDPAYYQITHEGGRRKVKLEDALQTCLQADLEESPRLATWKLIQRLEASAKLFKLDLPGEWALRRIIEETRGGVLGTSAAGNGRRAAETDGVPHETLPYALPHECWTEDELVLPLWLGIWHLGFRRWVSTLLYVAFVLDYVSRAILSWQLCDPRRRRGARGEQVFTGFDEDDVATAFLKAARPELAPEFLVPFTGFLPEHIRMDGHATHHAWRRAVKPHIPTEIHLLADYRPYRNGIQERAGFTIKAQFDAFFAGTPGHVDAYIPTDRIRQNQHEARVQSAATTERPRRKTEILPEDLPRVEDVDKLILPHVVRFYNYDRKHSAHGMTPYDAFMSQRPRRNLLTPSDSLVRALPVEVVTAARGSIQLQRDGVVRLFDHRISGRILPVGSSVTTHVHPLSTSLWAVDGRERDLVHIPALRDASADRDAKYIARARAEMTGGLSERAQDALNTLLERRVGAERAHETREAAERNIAGEPAPTPSPTPDGRRNAANLGDMIAAGSATPVSGADIWLGTPKMAGAPGADGAARDVRAAADAASNSGAPPTADTPAPAMPLGAPAATQTSALGSHDPASPRAADSLWLGGLAATSSKSPDAPASSPAETLRHDPPARPGGRADAA